MDDATAVARARAGDGDAFRLLVERHSRALFKLGYRMTGNEQDAEDVVQEAFLKAYRRLDQFESRANFGSWLYRIAANCSVDVLRARVRRDERPFAHGTEDEEELAPLAATDPGPDRIAHASELRRRIETALANAGYGAVVMHEMPFSVSRSRVGYFRDADRPAAEALIGALRGVLDGVELRDYRTLIEAPQPGRLDLWIRS